MKFYLRTVVISAFALALSTVVTGCAGCGNDTNHNKNDMVESTPAVETSETVSEEDTLATETFPAASEPATDGGNATANDIQGTIDENNYTMDENGNRFDANGNRVDENGNIIDDAGNIISEAGDAVGNVVDNVGNAVNDVVDGIGDGARSLTR